MSNISNPAQSPLINVFAMLGANASFANGFAASAGANLTAGETSPFMSLLGGSADAQVTADASPLIVKGKSQPSAAPKISHAAVPAAADKSEDLSSTDLLMSDLLALNWDGLEKGDTVTLAGGWTLTLNGDGNVAIENADGSALVPFSKNDFSTLLSQLKDRAAQIAAQMNQDSNALESAAIDAKDKPQKKSKPSDVAEARNGNPTNAQYEAAPADNARRTQALSQLQAHAANANKSGAAQGNVTTGLGAAGLASANAAASVNGVAQVAPVEHSLMSSLNLYGFTDIASIDADGLPAPIAGFSAGQLRDLGLRPAGNGMLTGTQSMSPAQLNVIIQKLADRGGDKKLMVQLDPTELGRVQVDISSARDKSMKAAITVERPETLALLQKDLGSLERALQSAGLSMTDGSITLDLANDGQFNQGQNFAQEVLKDEWQDRIEGARASGGRGGSAGGLFTAVDDTQFVDGVDMTSVDASIRRLVAMGVLNVTV